MIKKTQSYLRLYRERFLVAVIVLLMLIIAYLLGLRNVFIFSQQKTLVPTSTILTITPVISLTQTPTLSPNPTIAKPIFTPTSNPVIENRIKAIDDRINQLKQTNQSKLKIAGESTDCITLSCTMMRNQLYDEVNSNQREIQQLEAERTQLLLQ